MFLLVLTLFALTQDSELSYKAERLEGFKSSKGEGRKLFENVEIWQDSLLINCDSAIYYFKIKIAELEGNVEIFQNNLKINSKKMTYFGSSGLSQSNQDITIINNKTTLRAGKGKYFKNEGKADFAIDVTVDDDSTRINAQRIIYFKNTEESNAYDSVTLHLKHENVYLLADTVKNYPFSKKTNASGSPILFKIDSTISAIIKYDTTSISSEKMIALRSAELNQYQFFKNVEIVKDDVKARANKCIFYRNEDLIVLSGKPGVYLEKTQLYADSIVIFLIENKLEKIKAFNNAINISLEDTNFPDRKSQISGDSIIISFRDNQIERLFAYHKAKILFFLFDEGNSDGATRNSSESIEIFFEENEASKVIIHDGNKGETPEGEMIPEVELQNNIKSLYLKQHKWLDTLPQKKYLKLEYSKSFN